MSERIPIAVLAGSVQGVVVQIRIDTLSESTDSFEASTGGNLVIGNLTYAAETL